LDELSAGRARSRARFPVELARAAASANEARDRGLLTRGLLDDIVCLAPPFTILRFGDGAG